jgi:hypothetical protein
VKPCIEAIQEYLARKPVVTAESASLSHNGFVQGSEARSNKTGKKRARTPPLNYNTLSADTPVPSIEDASERTVKHLKTISKRIVDLTWEDE